MNSSNTYKSILRVILKSSLILHNYAYRLASRLAIRIEDVHPKHRIIRYSDWYLERVFTDDVVIDIGSHAGCLSQKIAVKAARVYGIERNLRLVQMAQQTCKVNNLSYFCADATTFDYSQLEPVTVITLSNVLEHIEFRVEFLRCIVGCIRWRQGRDRRILIRVPMFNRDWITSYKRELGIEWRLDPEHFVEYTQTQLSGELAQAGIAIVEQDVSYGEIYALCIVLPKSGVSVSENPQ